MTQLLEHAIEELQRLPEAAQDFYARQILGGIEDDLLEGWTEAELKQAIKRGLASGPAREIGFDEIKRRGRERLAARADG